MEQALLRSPKARPTPYSDNWPHRLLPTALALHEDPEAAREPWALTFALPS